MIQWCGTTAKQIVIEDGRYNSTVQAHCRIKEVDMKIVLTLEVVLDKTNDWENVFLGSSKVRFWPKAALHVVVFLVD